MAPRTFARRFRAETGATPHDWLTGQRVLFARRLLEDSDLGVDSIADAGRFRQRGHPAASLRPPAEHDTAGLPGDVQGHIRCDRGGAGKHCRHGDDDSRANRVRALRSDRRPGQADGAAGVLHAGHRGAAARATGCWSATAAATSRTRTSAVTCTTCSPSSAPSRTGARGRSSASRLRFAGGGFDTDDPGSLLDVIAEARRRARPEARSWCTIWPYRRWPSRRLTEALGAHGLAEGARVVFEKPFGTSPDGFRKLNRRCTGCWTRSRSIGSTISWARRRPRTCTCCGSPTSCSRRCGTASTSRRADRRAGDARASTTGPVLRRHRRRAGHAGHPPVPGGGRGGDGAAGQPGRRRSAGRPGEGDRQVPAAGPGRGGARPVRRIQRRRGRRTAARRTDTFVAARLWIDNAALARACRSCCAPASGWRRASSGSASFSGRPPGPLRRAAGQANVLSFSLGRRRRDRPVAAGQAARRRAGAGPAPVSLPLAELPERANRCRRTSG